MGGVICISEVIDISPYLPRTSRCLPMVVLCNSWSSVSLPILSVSCWQWWPMTSTRLSSSPLLYAVSMSSRVCSLLMPGVFLVGITVSQIHTPLAFHLCFCGSNEINHFFCDLPPLFFLSCSGAQVNELVIFTNLVSGFGFYWTENYFRSPCLLFLYHPFSLEDPLCWGEIQSFFHLHLPFNCCGDFSRELCFLCISGQVHPTL